MLSNLTTHREEIARLCRRYGVARLTVFGSAATDDFDPARSDIDLLVVFEQRSGINRFDAHLGLKEDLEALLGHPVDLLATSALTNPYFARSVEQTRQELFELPGRTTSPSGRGLPASPRRTLLSAQTSVQWPS